MKNYYEVQIVMNSISKLKYVGHAEVIEETETLDRADGCAIKIYEDIKTGNSSEYLSESIYRPHEGHCITGVEIMKFDGNVREFVKGYYYEPYVQ